GPDQGDVGAGLSRLPRSDRLQDGGDGAAAAEARVSGAGGKDLLDMLQEAGHAGLHLAAGAPPPPSPPPAPHPRPPAGAPPGRTFSRAGATDLDRASASRARSASSEAPRFRSFRISSTISCAFMRRCNKSLGLLYCNPAIRSAERLSW